MKKVRMFLVCFFLVVLSSSLMAQDAIETQTDQFDVVLGLDFVVSQDYHDVMESALSRYQVSGGYGWLGANFGIRYKKSENFSIAPNVALWLNFINFGVDTTNTITTNTIVIPGISATYQLKAAPSLYARGEVNYNFPKMDLYPMATGGFGAGAALGYCFDILRMELGYVSVPVHIFGDLPVEYESANMGGLIFKTSLGL